MIEKILRAKHWHLFSLSFGIPMIFQIVWMVVMFANIGNENNPDSFLFFMAFFPIIMILIIATQFGWLWSVAIGLQYKVPENVKMKVKKFKILFFIPFIYITSFLLFISLGVNGLIEGGKVPQVGLISSLAMIIIPLHLFSMFCIFYSLYFTAKTYKTAELQREVNFSDFAGEFFMIWFYPIGIWKIQPKINKMIAS